jgi:hypothetical protein
MFSFKSRILAAAALCATVTAPLPAQAMMQNLSGAWSGKGTAYVKGLGQIRAGCRFKVDETKSRINMDGSCGIGPLRGKLGLKLNISESGAVSGTYSGSRSGPASLNGRIDGNALLLDIRWNKPVNGDRSARMVLRRINENSFSQVVTDNVDGETIKTSNFSFSRR